MEVALSPLLRKVDGPVSGRLMEKRFISYLLEEREDLTFGRFLQKVVPELDLFKPVKKNKQEQIIEDSNVKVY